MCFPLIRRSFSFNARNRFTNKHHFIDNFTKSVLEMFRDVHVEKWGDIIFYNDKLLRLLS
jgi:hypothetical protein